MPASNNPRSIYDDRMSPVKEPRTVIDLDDGELEDTHMFGACSLLAKQFPGVSGLQDTLLGPANQFRVVTAPFVQILHNDGSHWLTSAFVPQGDAADVIVYDSLYDNINTHTQHLITRLLKCAHSPITCAIATTQRQTGVKDCGLFAIATATSSCFGECPSERRYDQSMMRGHFRQCLERGEMTPFPSIVAIARKIRSITDINVYCSCRLPDNEEERVVECDHCHDWFHQSCQQVITHAAYMMIGCHP